MRRRVQERTETIRATLESTADGILVVDSAGRTVAHNQKFRTMWAIPESVLKLRNRDARLDFIQPQLKDPETFIRKVRAVYADIKAKTDDVMECRDGRIFECHSEPQTVRGIYEGRVWGFRDVTERKRAEVALRESEFRYRQLFDRSESAQALHEMVFDAQGNPSGCRFLDVNPAFERLTGLSRSRIVGRSAMEVLPDLEEYWIKLYGQVAATGEPAFFEKYAKSLGRTYSGAVYSPRPNQLVVSFTDVTERLLAEKALLQSEERYRTLFENAPVGIFRTSPDGRILVANSALVRMFGYSSWEELEGRDLHIGSFEPEYPRSQFLERMEKQGEVTGWECMWHKQDGGVFYVRENARAIRDDSGKTLFYECTAEDITERKRAEEELTEERHLLHTLMDNLPDVIYFKDRESRFTRINKAHAEQFGLKDPAQAVGKTDFDFFGAEHAQEAHSDEEKIIKTGHPLVGKEEKEVWPDGHVTWVTTTKMPLRDANGNIVGTFGVSHDITQRKQAEEAVRWASAYNRSLIEASLDPLVTIAPDGKVTDVNNATETVTGLPRQQLIGTDFSDYFTDPGKARAGYEQVFREGLVQDYELEIRHRDGHVTPVLYNASVYRGDTGDVIGVFAAARDITERKLAEAALLESEERFRSLIENATVGIYRTTPQGRILMANPALVKMLGFKDFEALATRNLEEEGFESDYLRRIFLERINRNREVRGLEEEWTRQDGSVIFIRESVRAIRGKDGTVLYYDGIVEDITERKQAEETLRLTQFSMENASDAIFWLDSQGHIVYVNDAATRSLERSRDELLSLSMPDIDPLVTKEAGKAFWEKIKTRGSITFETRYQTKQGSAFPVEVNANYLEFQGKEYCFAFARDITERKRADAEHVRLVTAIEQSAEAVMITNTTGEIEYVNPAFTRITGYGREEVLGQNPRFLKSGKHDAEFYQQLWAAIRQGNTWQGELTNRRKDGSLYTEQMIISAMRGERGEVTQFIATKQDVTARKQLEQQFAQAQKMEAVGRLAGGVAHDFNNLLTIINGYAQLLLERTSPEDPHRGLFEEIQMAGDRAASLTRQLLAFSRRQVMEPRVLDLNSVLANTEKMLRRLIGEDVELVSTLQPDLGLVKVDPGQIEQVIMNLAVNARDAMPEGGKFLVETSNVEVDEEYARSHSNLNPGKYVMVAVSDTGCGMDLETQAHVFEPFFTTKEKGRGTGLGLATVYGIVQQSGGYIWVYSEPGRGSTFKIYLPRIEGDMSTPEPAEAPLKPAKGKGTILVVEDEKGVRSMICETLKSRAYKVLEADGAAQALEIAEAHTKPIHLLLTDVVMPHTGGKELAKHLSTLHPETKVLYMSGYTDDAIVRHGIMQGDTPFLQKPFSPEALARKVREMLKRAPRNRP
ncbi:MAG: PAS domain S-box protein [Terriglobia bacterium]